jgi:hypothetical protein
MTVMQKAQGVNLPFRTIPNLKTSRHLRPLFDRQYPCGSYFA